jgi:hypothetical protein
VLAKGRHITDILVAGMTNKNPFPGMNPFFERTWRDAHTVLVGYIRDDLQPRLPPDLVARAEEGVTAVSEEGQRYYPDVRLSEPWILKEGGTTVAAEPPVVADEPIRVFHEEETERWVEIRDASGRLITAIELLSPTNKKGGGMDDYLRKRRGFIQARVNLVEIDLVREGSWVFSGRVRDALEKACATYGISVFRAANPIADEVYPIDLRKRLPAIRIPLRQTDPDVVLNLQPLINQCYERGRYHMLDYRTDPEPSFSASDAAWMDALLRDAGLRD